MARPPSIQWYYKQWLGDNKVLAMDWDAQAMHFHLLMMSIQEEPAGSIPSDVMKIRRWLRLPSGQSDSDRVWARVQPQIFAAWMLEDERWFNAGMVATMERSENYRNRYENGTKNPPDPMKTVEEVGFDVVLESKSKAKPSFEEVRLYCLERNNSVDPQKWFDHYTANGWKVGRNAMKDWRAAVRNWERNSHDNQAVSKVEQRTNRNRAAILTGLGIGPNVGPGGPDYATGSTAGGNPLLVGDIPE